MRLSSIPQLYRHLRRWREILVVLQRYGLADWISQFRNLPFRDVLKNESGVPLANLTRPQRVRMALTDLGPTFIKLGQLLSSRPDLVGIAMADELSGLRADVPAESAEWIATTLREELGEDYRQHFQQLDDEPSASASIGQVLMGVLQDETPVVVKVQRRDIAVKMEQDLDILMGLAQLAERVDALPGIDCVEMVRQFSPSLLRELDFNREQQNLRTFDAMFEEQSAVEIPAPIQSLCTKRVLVMRRMPGNSLQDLIESESRPSNGDRSEIARVVATAYMEMLFEHGTFHADPHSGNLFAILPPPQSERDDTGDQQPSSIAVGIIDFGMVGRIDEGLREKIEEMLYSIATSDQHQLTRLIKRTANAPADLNDSMLAVDIADFIALFGNQQLDRFDLAAALQELSSILHRHGIQLPNQSALLLKMLISLEGTLTALGADFNSMEIMRSFMRRAMLRRYSPRRRLRQARRIYMEAEHFLQQAPDRVIDLMDQAQRGSLRLHLEHQRLGPSVNRLVLGLMASALFLGSSLLLAMKVPPVLFEERFYMGLQDVSVLGLIGVFVSVSVMGWLVIAIARSGHLTRGTDD
ncbi:MAG: AarF/UbiB family protein [Planctomycetota bacterium]